MIDSGGLKVYAKALSCDELTCVVFGMTEDQCRDIGRALKRPQNAPGLIEFIRLAGPICSLSESTFSTQH